MKRVLFLSSHLGSNTEHLAALLEQSPRVQFYELSAIYKHPNDLAVLTSLPHKNDTTGAIYAAHLVLNDGLSGRSLYKCCSFVYFIRRARPAITEIIQKKLYTPESAVNMYIFRIRRLYEMAVQTPGAVFVTWDNLKENKGLDLIEDYLGLSPLDYREDYFSEPEECVLQSQVAEAEEAYEGIVYRMKKLNLRFVSQQ